MSRRPASPTRGRRRKSGDWGRDAEGRRVIGVEVEGIEGTGRSRPPLASLAAALHRSKEVNQTVEPTPKALNTSKACVLEADIIHLESLKTISFVFPKTPTAFLRNS